MDKDELVRLAERVEAATGPDRELDRAIQLAIRKPVPSDRWTHADEWPSQKPRHFTGSFDAAMTLKGNWLLDYIQEHEEGYATAGLYRRNPLVLSHDRATGNGKTPALALCAAALRARSPEGTK